MDNKPTPENMEVVLYSLYSVATISNYTRDLITKSQSRQLLDLEAQAHRRKQNAKDDEEEQVWRNVRDMADVMGDRKLRVFVLRPTWEMKRELSPKKRAESMRDQQAKGAPSRAVEKGTETKQVSAPTSAVVKASTTNAAVIPPIQPKASSSTMQPKPIPIREPSPAALPAPEPINAPTPAAPELNILARSKPPSVSDTPVPPPSNGISILVRSSQPPANLLTQPAASTSAGLSILARAKQPQHIAGSSNTNMAAATPAKPPTPATSGLSIKSHATTNGSTNSASTSADADASMEVDQAVVSKPSPGLSIRSAASTPNPTNNVNPKSLPLISRIGSGSKRPRDDSTTAAASATPTPRTLAQQFQVPSERKKARQDQSSPLAPTPTSTAPTEIRRGSLLSRISSGRSTPGSPVTPTTPGSTGSPFGRTVSGPTQNQRTNISNWPTKTQAPTQTFTPMSIAGRASSQASTPRVVSATVDSPAATSMSGDGVIRKGRGFGVQETLTPPPSKLADRLGTKVPRGRELL